MNADMNAPSVFVVHYRLDNVRRTPGLCRTDHALQPGDVLDVGDERAIVRSCHAVTVVPALRVYAHNRRIY